MRKKLRIIFYTLFFMVSGIFESYTLLELRHDIVSLGCSSVVMLIATYLFLDMIIDCYREEKAMILQAKEKDSQVHKDLQEMLKYQKALLIINKKILDQKEEV